MAGEAVSAFLGGNAGPDGTLTAIYSVPVGRTWQIERQSASGTSTPTDATIPQLRVYRNGTLIGASAYPLDDVSSEPSPIAVRQGDQIRAEWVQANPGQRLTLTLDGTSL